jgi:hypothetical protein
MDLLTIQDVPHILDKTIHDFKGLRSGRPSLVLGQPVQSLKNRPNVILPQKLLYEFYCVALSQAA